MTIAINIKAYHICHVVFNSISPQDVAVLSLIERIIMHPWNNRTSPSNKYIYVMEEHAADCTREVLKAVYLPFYVPSKGIGTHRKHTFEAEGLTPFTHPPRSVKSFVITSQNQGKCFGVKIAAIYHN